MQKLLVYQALWGMEGLAGVDLDRALDAELTRIFEAGFDGVGVGLTRPERATRVARRVAETGRSFEAIAFARTEDDVGRLADMAQALGAHHLTLQILTRTDRVSDAVRILQSFERRAARADIPVYYETHRGRLTNDLLFMGRVLDELPALRLAGDLSHYVVAHEMGLPVSDGDLGRVTKVLDHSWAFHGRVSNGQQVQVSIEAPQHRPWADQFRAWWRQGFESWSRRSAPDAELTFMPELGPPPYAITDATGTEISDRWAEALALADMARKLWSEIAALPAGAAIPASSAP